MIFQYGTITDFYTIYFHIFQQNICASRVECRDHINRFNPGISQTSTCFSSVICRVKFLIFSFFFFPFSEINCSFFCWYCQYWWNCWPSLFKLSFYKVLLRVQSEWLKYAGYSLRNELSFIICITVYWKSMENEKDIIFLFSMTKL